MRWWEVAMSMAGMRRRGSACMAALFALYGCSGDRPGGGRESGDEGAMAGKAGDGNAAPAGASAPMQPQAGSMAAPTMMPAPTAPASDPGGKPAGTFKPRVTLDPT